MAYEEFQQHTQSQSPGIAIGPHGTLRFNSNAARLLRETGVQAVALLWDKDRNTVGIRPVASNYKNALKISYGKANPNHATISGKGFLTKICWISRSEDVKVPLTWDEKEKMLAGKIPQTVKNTP